MTAKLTGRLASILLMLIVFAVLFAGGEMVLRAKFPDKAAPPAQPQGWAIIPERTWIEYHPRIGWVPKKGTNSMLRKNNLQIPVSTSSLGLRGRQEYTKAKPAGKFRIYAAGDSFTFGFGVQDDEVFTHRMETMDPSVEVFNLGVPGYGVDQIYLFLREFGFSYKPDVALVLIYPEDFWRATRAFNDAGFGKPYFKLRPDGALELLHVPVPLEKNFAVPQFPVFIEKSFFDKMLGWSRWYWLGQKAVLRMKKKMGMEDPDTEPEWLLGRRVVEETVGLLRKNGVKPVLVMVPPQRWFAGTVEPVRDSLSRLAAREKVDFLDLTPVFQNAMKETGKDIFHYYIQDDLHWTAAGHDLVAREILKFLGREKKST